MRHGRAEERAPDEADADRRLSADGIAQLAAAAPLWRRLNLRPDLVLTSPLVRAARTAELLLAATGSADAAVADGRLAPGAEWGHFAQAMADHPDARRVLFVGHNPDVAQAVALLCGASSVRMRPGGLACLEFYGVPEPGAGEIAWLLDPDLYVAA